MTGQAAATAQGTYASIAEKYDERYVGPRWDLYDHITLDAARTVLPPGPCRVLDAGAGSGKFAVRFLREGHEVTLLDPSEEMLAVARRKVEAEGLLEKARFVPGTIETLPFPDGAFDFVFSEGDPLSYCIATHRQAAKELVRVLRPGGGLYVSCDNRWYAALAMLSMGRADLAFAAAEQGASFDPYGAPVHAFGPGELREVLEAAGAVDVRVTGKVGLAHFLGDSALNALLEQEDARRRLYAIEAALGRDPAMAGLASHLHAVGRRP